jgi:adenylate kinase family enzyme
MQRIVVFGGSGSGKSISARALGAALDIPVVHLDALYYQPGWRDPDPAVFQARVEKLHATDRWISDGNFIALTAAHRLPRADTVVLLEQPTWLRLFRALRRGLAANRNRPDLAPGCHDSVNAELVADVWRYGRTWKPMIEAAIRQYAPQAVLVPLNGDRAAAAFLGRLSQ